MTEKKGGVDFDPNTGVKRQWFDWCCPKENNNPYQPNRSVPVRFTHSVLKDIRYETIQQETGCLGAVGLICLCSLPPSVSEA
jgi:hypothetical protein